MSVITFDWAQIAYALGSPLAMPCEPFPISLLMIGLTAAFIRVGNRERYCWLCSFLL